MRVLGIDPGSDTTGWGVIEGDGRHYRLLEYGVIRSSPRQKFPTRLLRISNGIEEVIARHRPEACAIEDLMRRKPCLSLMRSCLFGEEIHPGLSSQQLLFFAGKLLVKVFVI